MGERGPAGGADICPCSTAGPRVRSWQWPSWGCTLPRAWEASPSFLKAPSRRRGAQAPEKDAPELGEGTWASRRDRGRTHTCHPFLVNALKGQGYGRVWVGQTVNSPGDPELSGQVFPWGLVPPGHSLVGRAALLEFGRGSWYHGSDGVVDAQSPGPSGRQSNQLGEILGH